MQQQHNNVEHTPTYEIAFGAGADLAAGVPGLDTSNQIRQAYRYYQSVIVLQLPLDECIEAFCHRYQAMEMGIV